MQIETTCKHCFQRNLYIPKANTRYTSEMENYKNIEIVATTTSAAGNCSQEVVSPCLSGTNQIDSLISQLPTCSTDINRDQLLELPSPDIVRDQICVPRSSVFTANLNVYTDLETFAKLTDYVPASTKTLVKNKFPSVFSQVRALGKVFRNLRRTVISSTRNDYTLIQDKPVNELFSYESLQQWRQMKSVLVNEISKHKDAQSHLGEARKMCWKTEAKVKKYQLIVDTQSSAIKHNPAETVKRTAAMKEMQSVLARNEKLHERAVSVFYDKYLREISIREGIRRLAKEIESEVVAEMANSIARLMQANRQNMSATKVEEYAQAIYTMTCRSYEFDCVMCEPCQKAWIGEPAFHGSKMDKKAMLKL